MSGSTITARVLQSNGNNYTAQMNFGGPVWGTYGQYLNTVGAARPASRPSLRAATSTSASIRLTFSTVAWYAGQNADGTTFDIRTLANGYTEINPATYPSPRIHPSRHGPSPPIGFRRKVKVAMLLSFLLVRHPKWNGFRLWSE